jgi:uncharacterized membrane protein YjjP (DUF1212 family)
MTIQAKNAAEITKEHVSIRSLVDLLVEICRVAIECGCSSNRLEALVGRLGDAWGYSVEAAALPTAVWLNVKGNGQHVLELVRVKQWSINLDRLSLLNELVDDVENHVTYLDEAVEKLSVIARSKSPYHSLLTYAAGGGISITLTYSYGGRGAELAASFAIGVLCQFIFKRFAGENRRFLAEFFSAMCVALAASFAVWASPEMSLPRLVIGGLISLFPGLVFVNSLHEIAQKNLSSGSARLMEACMIAVNLSCGVAAALGVIKYVTRMLG